MALAGARAAWQRTANRCSVQEDAKRAPKLAYHSSLPPSVKQQTDDMGPTNTPVGQDIPTSEPQPFNRNPSHSNLPPNTKWWLHLQPNYGHQKGLMDEQFNSLEGNIETLQMQESMDDNGLTDQTTCSQSSYENQYMNLKFFEKKDFGGETNSVGELRDEGLFSAKNANEVYFEYERNSPWWRTADTEELALLVAQRSLGVVENCDLPRPQNTRFKKNSNVNMCCFGHDEVITTSIDSKIGIGSGHFMSSCASVPGSVNARSSCQKLRMTAGAELYSGVNKPLRDGPPHEKMHEMPPLEDEASRAKLMEALRHSQTRAREAETMAQQAYTEKEHVMKLVFRQASQLFAYKQWLYFLQLENRYFQFMSDNNDAISTIFLPQKSRKTRKSSQKSSCRKRGKKYRPWCDFGKYALVLAFGLGLVGAGLLLGWTIAGWMLPI